MPEAYYDAIAFAMRDWFILVAGLMLLALILVSRSEYRARKAVMGEVGAYVGYLEVIGGADDVLGERIGIMNENTVGSARQADIVINDASVQKSHAMIYKKGDKLILTPLQKGMTKINGRRAVRPHELFTGDRVSFGNIETLVYVKPKGEDDDD